MSEKLNKVGLAYFYNRLKTVFASKTSLDTLSARVEEIISEGGEPNVIEVVKRNGTALPITSKAVDVAVPTKTSELSNDGDGSVPFATTVNATTGAAGLMSASDKTKLEGIEAGAEANVQANWTQTSATADDFIKNKPTKLSDFTNDGDGTTGSKYATEKYVGDNGGKIDKIKVNNVEQPITNKTVNIEMPEDLTDLTNTDADPFARISDVEAAHVGALRPKGSIAFANLPALVVANLNNMYSITDAFTTTADFVEGAGHSHPAGTNVSIINVGTDAAPVYKYDAMTGVMDMSGYWSKTELVDITTAEIDAIIDAPTP